MKKLSAIVAVVGAAILLLASDGVPGADGPQYTSDGQLMRPKDYREWVFVTSGLGMTYGPLAADHLMFDNVFANRAAYRSFMETGRWPDKSVLVLEVRGEQSKGSINREGHFQTDDIMGMEVHVKDEKRFKGGWGFFQFRGGTDSAKLTPYTESCYSCHQDHGAVDTTFVQFYPTLLEVAKAKGTAKATATDEHR